MNARIAAKVTRAPRVYMPNRSKKPRLFMFSSQPYMIRFVTENWKRLLSERIDFLDDHHAGNLVSAEYNLPELIVAARRFDGGKPLSREFVRFFNQIYDPWNLISYLDSCPDLAKHAHLFLCYHLNFGDTPYPIYYEILQKFGIKIPTKWNERSRVEKRIGAEMECPICFEQTYDTLVSSCKQCGGTLHLLCVKDLDRCPLCRHVAV